jgi:WD40 repeat protein/DNA-binding SARP family transcriptional activator
MAASRLEFRILGPLAVRVDGSPVAVGGPKQRALLALLLLSANRVVSRDRLIEELFAEQSLNSADHALRNHVSRLRKVLAPAVPDEPRLVARAPGYLLRVEQGELDLEQFEQLVAEGREALGADDPIRAVEELRAAERLWRDRPLADLEFEPFARFEVERLEELRLAAVEERIDAELTLGKQLTLVPELEVLGAEHPYRERFRAQLMLALYRSGRQAEGLEVYRRTRTLLNEELGLEPSVELQQLERAILVQDPVLNANGQGAPKRLPPPRDVCPFKGLAPFEAADAEFFFGRERLVHELVARLADAPLLAIIGASGSGKSSLIRAGLLPAFELDSLLIRPNELSAAGLRDTLARAHAGDRYVIAVDQFEELFDASIPELERRAFVDLIVETTWDPARHATVVLALRADFFGRLASYVELADLVGPNHVLLGPMSVGELRRAIEGPAARTGLDVEPALVDAVVDDVAGEAGALPLLSTALLDLWRERDGPVLALTSYKRTGGVRGAVGRHAEAAFLSLGEDEQAVARRVMLRLVAGGDGRALTRRRVTVDELGSGDDERIARVLEALIERRLLVADDGRVELVHEALLEQWPRLTDWLEDDVQGRQLHEQLTRAAAEWEAARRDPSELYRGARLAATIEWAEAAGSDAGLNRRERAFLEESRTAYARANRRLRGLLAVAVLLLAAALVGGGLALEARGSARRSATAAIAERLGAQALVDPSLDRSLLLAREGSNLDDSLATRSNLLAALLRGPDAIGVAHEGSDRLLDESLSPDSRTLAVRGDDGNVVLFNARTLRRVGRPIAGSDQVGLFGSVRGPLHALAFSPDGRTLAIGGTGGIKATVELVRTATHTPSAQVTSADIITADLVFAPDGRTLATGEPVTGRTSPPTARIVLRDASTGRARAQTRPVPGGRLAGYTHDGRFLLVVSGQRRSLVFDARTLARVKTLPVSGAAALSPTADQAAFGHADGSVTLIDLSTGNERTLSGRARGSVDALTFSHDGSTLATGTATGAVDVWNVHAGMLRETLTGHSAAVRAVVFSPDGRTLYTASYDGSVIAWDIAGARRLGQPFRYRSSPGSAASAVSRNGLLFALSPGPDRVALWRSRTRKPLARNLRGPVGDVNGLAFSQDGTLVAAAGSRHAVLWNTTTKKAVAVLPVGGFGADAVAFDPKSHTLAIGRADGVDAVYDVRNSKEVAQFKARGSTVAVDFSPDGRLLASASLTGNVTVWNVAQRNKVFELAGPVAAFAVRFSPDGKLLAVGDSSGTVALWDTADGKRVGQPLTGHGGGVGSIDFDPGGGTLVTSSDDGNLRLWDVATRKLIGAPLPGSTTGGSVQFFPDGKHLLGVFGSGAGVVWNVDPAAWKAKACDVARRNLTRAEWTDFLGRRRYRDVCP